MAVNVSATRPARSLGQPNLLNQYRSEFQKWRKQIYFLLVAVGPLLLIGGIILIQSVALVTSGRNNRTFVNTFSQSSSVVLGVLDAFYPILIVVLGGLMISNEYNWSTIKMMATRQPSRPTIVLAKHLYGLTTILTAGLCAIIAFVLYGFFLKIFYSQDLAVNSDDSVEIGRFFRLLPASMLQMLVWMVVGMALAVFFKSNVGAIIGYFIYNTVDGVLSQIGATYARSGAPGAPDWLRFILEIAKAVNPYLINSSLTRIKADVSPQPANFLRDTPSVFSWFVLLVYIGLFGFWAISTFTRRDITD